MARSKLELLTSIRSELNALEAELVRTGADAEYAAAAEAFKDKATEVLRQLREIRELQRKVHADIAAVRKANAKAPTANLLNPKRVLDLEADTAREAPPASAKASKRVINLNHGRGRAAPPPPARSRRLIDIGNNDTERPVRKRELLVEALSAIGLPAPPATASAIIKRLHDVEFLPSQFASFRKSDDRAWHKGKRDKELIVTAINAFDLTARPRTAALSTWPLELRIMGSLSDRANALRTVLKARDKWVHEGDEAWLDLLFIFARDFRFVAPDAERNTDEAMRVAASAKEALARIEEQDESERREAAERAERLPEEWQVFGRPLGFDVIAGGKND